jgi:hypothetical protein
MQVIDAPRPRLGFTGEGSQCLLLLVGTLWVAPDHPRAAGHAPPAAQTEPASSSVEAVPADAVSVPALMVGGSHEISGRSRGQALKQLVSPVTLVKQTVERGPIGTRDPVVSAGGHAVHNIVRAVRTQGQLRVAAIYLQ